MTSTTQNVYNLNEGDKVSIDSDEFTYHHSYHDSSNGFVVGAVEQCGHYCDGYHIYEINRKGQVDIGGALIGEIRDGEFVKYEKPII